MVGELSSLGLSLFRRGRAVVGAEQVHLFLLAGQSGIVGDGALATGADVYPAAVTQWGRTAPNNGLRIATTVPLDHVDPTAGSFGPDIEFFKLYCAANPTVSVVLVPCGDGGTGVAGEGWGVGETNYLDAVSRTNAALAGISGATFKGILWSLGQQNVFAATTRANYQTGLDATFAAFRANITGATNVPITVLGIPQGFATAQGALAEAVMSINRNAPQRLAYCAYADSVRPTVLTSTDNVHFNATGQRALGVRGYASYLVAVAAATVTAWDTDATTLFAAFSTPATAAAKGYINDAILGFKVNTSWADTDVMWCEALETAQAALINWKAPASFACTTVGSPVFTANQGYTGAVGKYLRSNWNPRTNTTQMSANDVGIRFKNRTSRAAATTVMFGANDLTSRFTAGPRTAIGGASTAYIKVCDDADPITVAGSDGLWTIERTSSSAEALYRNSVSVGSLTGVTSGALPNIEMYLLCENEGSPTLYCTDQLAWWDAGKSLGAKRAGHEAAITTLMLCLGA